MEFRTLASGQQVSVISVGSWQTFERMPFEDSVAVLERALEHGINFFDNARYGEIAPDASGESLPIPPGSPLSEVVFGRALAATGHSRESYILSNKVWFDTYPEQSFIEQVDASVRRQGLEYIDVVFCQVPPPGLDVVTIAREMGAVVASDRARTWGVINWTPDQLRAAHHAAREENFSPPSLTEVKYSVVRHLPAESPAYQEVYRDLDVRIHASNVFEGGLLTGKYATIEELAQRRILPDDVYGARDAFFAGREEYLQVAKDLDATPAQLALAFCLANADVASALIGAVRPEQIDDAVGCLQVLSDHRSVLRERLKLFAPHVPVS